MLARCRAIGLVVAAMMCSGGCGLLAVKGVETHSESRQESRQDADTTSTQDQSATGGSKITNFNFQSVTQGAGLGMPGVIGLTFWTWWRGRRWRQSLDRVIHAIELDAHGGWKDVKRRVRTLGGPRGDTLQSLIHKRVKAVNGR